jgi:hypothetical protein
VLLGDVLVYASLSFPSRAGLVEFVCVFVLLLVLLDILSASRLGSFLCSLLQVVVVCAVVQG